MSQVNCTRWVVGFEELVENEHYKTCTLEEALMYLNTLDEIQVDSETEGFDPHTKKPICWQLGDKTGENQFLFPYNENNMKALKPLLEKPDIVLVFQNAQFDLRFLRKDGIIVHNVFDVFLAECLLTTEIKAEFRRLGLDDLVFKYTGNLLNKNIRGNIHREGLTSRVIVYACEDVRYMSAIKEAQIKQLEELDLMNVMDLENKAVIAFSSMCLNGIKIDVTKWKEVIHQVKLDLQNQENKLDTIVISEPKLRKYCSRFVQSKLFEGLEERLVKINWSSNLQKKNLLKDVIGPEITDSSDRTLQKNKKKHKLISELISFNKLTKLESSFGENFLASVNKKTGRVHSQIWQIVSTGRISVSEPNLNQIPSKGKMATIIRSCFVSEEGYSIVGGDFSGMELRIIAEFSEDPVWVNAFIEGKDLHSVLCAMTFGIPESDVKKPFPLKPEMAYRDVQKTVNFGLAYGMSEFKLADTLDISTKEAKKIIEKFFKSVPKVKKLLDMFGDLAKKHGRIRTAPPFRRLRVFEDWEFAVETKDFTKLGEIERAGKNSPIQGTNADIIKLAMWKMIKEIDNNNLDVKILLSVYDEIRCECPDELAEYWRDRMNNIMLEAAQTVIKKVPIVVDCSIKKCWEK